MSLNILRLIYITCKPVKSLNLNIKHFYNTVGSRLIYREYGDPVKVLRKETKEISKPSKNEVLVKIIAAPVNPAAINTIQGIYPLKPKLPAVPGTEGVGEVIEVGPGAKQLAIGDRVVPLKDGIGMWQTHLVACEDDLLKVPNELGIVEAANLTVNPCTAFRMLRDFTDLNPGDTVIQNGANSACGQNVIQIARAWGLRSVNIVRDRPELADLKKFLTDLGATHVLTEEELRTTDIFKTGKLDKPKLGLNCVGGKSALELLRHVKNGSPMVTYGGMSREPVSVPTSALIFKDLQIVGFWMSQWSKDNADSIGRFAMFEALISMMIDNKLQGPVHEMVDFDNYEKAVVNTLTAKGMIGKKYILKFDSSN